MGGHGRYPARARSRSSLPHPNQSGKTMNQHRPTVTAEIADVVASLRAEVAQLHAELPRWGLVVWTAGNVSARVPGHDLLVIKPSGISYAELTPESMVVCDLE